MTGATLGIHPSPGAGMAGGPVKGCFVITVEPLISSGGAFAICTAEPVKAIAERKAHPRGGRPARRPAALKNGAADVATPDNIPAILGPLPQPRASSRAPVMSQ